MNRLIRCLSIVVDKKVDPTVVFLTTRETGREERSTEDFCPWNNVVIAVDVAELCVCVCVCGAYGKILCRSAVSHTSASQIELALTAHSAGRVYVCVCTGGTSCWQAVHVCVCVKHKRKTAFPP